jgi:hypothetical protein
MMKNSGELRQIVFANVRYGRGWRGAMPMFFIGLEGQDLALKI